MVAVESLMENEHFIYMLSHGSEKHYSMFFLTDDHYGSHIVIGRITAVPHDVIDYKDTSFVLLDLTVDLAEQLGREVVPVCPFARCMMTREPEPVRIEEYTSHDESLKAFADRLVKGDISGPDLGSDAYRRALADNWADLIKIYETPVRLIVGEDEDHCWRML